MIELYEQEIITLDFNKMIDAIESVSWTGRIEQVKRIHNHYRWSHNNESIEALIDTIKIITITKNGRSFLGDKR